jgi:hypothetical protein
MPASPRLISTELNPRTNHTFVIATGVSEANEAEKSGT